MGCFSINTGITSACETSIGGLKEVILFNDDVKFTLSKDVETNEVTGVSFTESSITTGNTFLYAFKKGQASMTTELQTGDTNYYTTNLMMNFSKLEATKRVAINALAKAQVRGVALDANGNAWLLGEENYLEATAMTAQTGQQRSDANNYSITLTAESTYMPIAVNVETEYKKLEDVAKQPR